MVSNIQGHYLTRNEDGILADYWEWPEDDSIVSWNNYPIENGFEFQYLPLYEDGDEYYVMFRLTDVQGNLYSSELLPAALEQEPEGDDECVQLQWDGDGTLCHQENGVSVSLYASIDYTTGQPAYQAEIRNDSDANIYVTLDDITVNETIYVSGRASFLTLRRWIPARKRSSAGLLPVPPAAHPPPAPPSIMWIT